MCTPMPPSTGGRSLPNRSLREGRRAAEEVGVHGGLARGSSSRSRGQEDTSRSNSQPVHIVDARAGLPLRMPNWKGRKSPSASNLTSSAALEIANFTFSFLLVHQRGQFLFELFPVARLIELPPQGIDNQPYGDAPDDPRRGA